MRRFLKHYFYFTKRQRTGILYLLSVLFVLILANNLIHLFFLSEKSEEIPDDRAVLSFVNQLNSQKNSHLESISNDYGVQARKNQLFLFEPNSASSNDFQKLGLSPKTIRTIINYRVKGGVFKVKTDLKKIYGLDSILYEQLNPYIDLPDFLSKPNYHFDEIINKQYKALNINTSSFYHIFNKTDFDSSLVWKLINYRSKLGGFYAIDQVLEIPDFQKEHIDILKSEFIVDQDSIKLININDCKIKELSDHPYLNFNQALAVINYRLKHGDYLTVDDIKKCKVVSDDVFQKLKPYLMVKQ